MKSFRASWTWRCVALLPIALLLMSTDPVNAWDSATYWAWHRTWHGPNALETPLAAYYVPRSPGQCGNSNGYYNGASATQGCHGTTRFRCECPPVAVAFEPVRFERLGRIPNDLEVAGGLRDAGAGVAGR